MRLLGSIRDDPEHWRERAEEARYVAKQMSDPVAREMMLRIAADDVLADGKVVGRILESGSRFDPPGLQWTWSHLCFSSPR